MTIKFNVNGKTFKTTDKIYKNKYVIEETNEVSDNKDIIMSLIKQGAYHYEFGSKLFKVIKKTDSYITCIPYNKEKKEVYIYESSYINFPDKQYVNVINFKIGTGLVPYSII